MCVTFVAPGQTQISAPNPLFFLNRVTFDAPRLEEEVGTPNPLFSLRQQIGYMGSNLRLTRGWRTLRALDIRFRQLQETISNNVVS
jgi:hypothetical protein